MKRTILPVTIKIFLILFSIVGLSSCEKVSSEYKEEISEVSIDVQTLTSSNILEWNSLPASPSIAKGETVQFIISAKLTSDPNKVVDITDKITWLLPEDNTLEVFGEDNEAKFLARNEGETILYATISGDENKKLEIPITIGPKVLRSLKINPDTSVIPIGTVFDYELFGIYGDGSPLTIGNEADVVSSNEEVLKATMVNGKLRLEALLVGDASITITAGTGEVLTLVLKVSGVDFYDIGFTPDDKILPTGAELDVVLTGYKSDNTTETIEDSYTVTSSNPSVIDLTEGKLVASLPGTAEIEVSYKNIKRKFNYVVANVNALERIEVTSYDDFLGFPNIPDGLPVKVLATGYFSNETSIDLTNFATWNKVDGDSTAVVTNQADEEFAEVIVSGSGNSIITAEYLGITGSITVNAIAAVATGIEVVPTAIVKNVGEVGDQFSANIVYSDGTKTNITEDVTWSVSAFTGNTAPTIGNSAGTDKGQILTNVSAGTATIQASYILDSVLTTANADFEAESITSGIQIVINGSDIFPTDTTDVNIAKGLSQNISVQATPSNEDVTDDAVITLDYSNDGYRGFLDYANATAFYVPFVSTEEGTITINASFGGFTATKEINVTPPTIAENGLSCPASSVKVTSGSTATIDCSVNMTDGTTLNAAAINAHGTITIVWDNPLVNNNATYLGSGSLDSDTSSNPTFTAGNAGYITAPVTIKDTISGNERTATTQIDFQVAANCTGAGNMLFGGNVDSDDLYCFYLGDFSESCTDVCLANGGVHDVTHVYGNSQSKCDALRAELYDTSSPNFSESEIPSATGSNAENLGCTVNETPDDFDITKTLYYFPVIDNSWTSADEGSQAKLKRYCSCNN